MKISKIKELLSSVSSFSRKHPEVFALVLTVLVFSLAVWAGEFRYRINDDTAISENARDGFYVRYVSALLVLGISFLTNLIDSGIDWYAVALFSANAFAFFLVVAAITRLSQSILTGGLLIILALAFFVPYIFTLSFTFSSILLGCASIAYAYAVMEGQGLSAWKYLLVASLAISLALMIRTMGGVGALAMGSGLFFILVFCQWKGEGSAGVQKALLAACIFLLLPAITVGSDYYLKANASQVYHSYEEYDAERGRIHGKKRMYRYLSDKEFLAKVGWRTSDAHNFKNWMFFDEERFGLDQVSRYNEMADAEMLDRVIDEHVSIDGVKERLEKIFSPSAKKLLVVAVMVVLFISLGLQRKRIGVELLIIALTPFLALLYLAFFSKVPARVTVPLVTGWTIIFLIFSARLMLEFHHATLRRRLVSAVVFLLCLFILHDALSPLSARMNVMRDRQSFIESQVKHLNEIAFGKVIIARPGKAIHEFFRDPFHVLDKEFYEVNVGWQTFSPRFYEQVSRVGASTGTELIEKIVSCEEIWILSNKGWANVMARYVAKKTGHAVKVRHEAQVGKNVDFYSIHAMDVVKVSCLNSMSIDSTG